jgi:hypothetical protein
MAQGGEVESFCSQTRMHDPGCEYYADGGDVFAPPTKDELSGDFPDRPADVPSQVDMLAPPSTEELSSSDLFAPPSESELKNEQDVSTLPQHALALTEAAGRGIAGPIATAAELGLSKLGVPGLSAEEQAARKEEYPLSTGITEAGTAIGSILMPGPNIAKAAMKGAEYLSGLSKFGALGKATIQGAIQSGILQGSDEISKALLGEGDPTAPFSSAIADIGAAGLFGIAAQYGSTLTSKLLDKAKLGSKLESWLQGVGIASAAKDPEARKIAEKEFHEFVEMPGAYNAGKRFVDNILNRTSATAGALGLYHGYNEDGLWGAAEYGLGGLFGGYMISRYAAPALFKIMGSQNLENTKHILDHAEKISKGAKKTNDFVDNLFKVVPQKGYSHLQINADKIERDRKKLNEYLEEGGITKDVQEEVYKHNLTPEPLPGFAEGGEVMPQPLMPTKPMIDNNPLADVYPDQNIMMQAAKGRVSNYLNSLRPLKNQPKLAFDDVMDQRDKLKSYNQALDIANHPLTVLQHIKNGTIETDHVKHLNNLYPEVYGHLQKKLTERITKAQMKGEKPPFKVRQGMSMFMNVPLSGEFKPQNIQAAQATFQIQKQQQAIPQPKKKTSAIGKSSQHHMLANQAAIGRQQRQGRG